MSKETDLYHLLGRYNIQALHLAKGELQNSGRKRAIDEVFLLITLHKKKLYPRGKAFHKLVEIENAAKHRKVQKLRAAIGINSGMEPEGK
ncbi:hypothetical protein KKJ17_20240 [Xenorhabdus bovienii]|uniref:hypothetical protein n=1 Tax=Xenorhabdus bovienii TaxID=40576 RepID=UPI00237D0AB2|nr:hypothetical protein [Xenorhabdus bovienii]MDE1488590.1 hypothetical protein [Xenorhabdus bovienii]MDE9479601.1 hypothetical protein [Xenorhabdus bovienii]MDE9495714.1 hypothetical protein [Xenorhabdus bovienii]MDE9504117.1 hypothetical protein [Xenorhabdus bovienii]MDE9519962.1 hypothetical protein [Xenorhabdus bovienii]